MRRSRGSLTSRSQHANLTEVDVSASLIMLKFIHLLKQNNANLKTVVIIDIKQIYQTQIYI